MMMDEFEVRSYGWLELAVLYGLDLMPASVWETVVQMDGDKTRAKDRATG